MAAKASQEGWSNPHFEACYVICSVVFICPTSAFAQEGAQIDLAPRHYVSLDLESPFEGRFIDPKTINDKDVNFETCDGNFLFVEIASVEVSEGSCEDSIGPLSMPASEFQRKMVGAGFYASDGSRLGVVLDVWVNSQLEVTGVTTSGEQARFWPVNQSANVWSDTETGRLSFTYLGPDTSNGSVALSYSFGVDPQLESAGIAVGFGYDLSDVETLEGFGAVYSVRATYANQSDGVGLAVNYDLGGGVAYDISNNDLLTTTFSLGVAMSF